MERPTSTSSAETLPPTPRTRSCHAATPTREAQSPQRVKRSTGGDNISRRRQVRAASERIQLAPEVWAFNEHQQCWNTAWPHRVCSFIYTIVILFLFVKFVFLKFMYFFKNKGAPQYRTTCLAEGSEGQRDGLSPSHVPSYRQQYPLAEIKTLAYNPSAKISIETKKLIYIYSNSL